MLCFAEGPAHEQLKIYRESFSGDLSVAELIYINVHPLEVVSRYRDPQLQEAEITDIWVI